MRALAADLAACATGYTLGSLPTGLWLARAARNIDVREHGSGGTGTTNILRTVGPGAAAAVFALDVAKGTAAVRLARGLGCEPRGLAAAGVAAMVGNSWPVFARFRGGKGVATGFGALLQLSGTGSASAVAGGMSALAITRIVSVGSLAAISAATLATGASALGRLEGAAPFGFCAGAAAVIVYRHRANIRRLAAGREPTISLRARTGL